MHVTALVLAMATLFTGCQRSLDTQLPGKWNVPNTPTAITFRSDHTFTMTYGDHTWTGTWQVQGHQLTTLTHPDPSQEQIDTYETDIRGDRLVFAQHTCVVKSEGRDMGEPQVDSGGTVIYSRVR
jgi:hypothetical protein